MDKGEMAGCSGCAGCAGVVVGGVVFGFLLLGIGLIFFDATTAIGMGLIGLAAGALLFGVLSWIFAMYVMERVQREEAAEMAKRRRGLTPRELTP